MKISKVLFFIVFMNLASCGVDSRHIEKAEGKKESASVAKEDTSICKADWEEHGELVFPGLVTLEECEAYCESIYEQVSSDGRWGYCQYGADRIWELPFYQE